MPQVRAWVGMIASVLVVGCSESDNPGSSGQAGSSGAGGAVTTAGSGGSSSGGGAASAGSSSTGGSAEPPTCTEQQVACNGACLEVGASQNGCTVLARQQYSVSDLALDADHVYFSLTGSGKGIHRLARSGGAPEPFAPEASVSDLTLNATHVLWTSSTTVQAMSKAGGSASELFTDTVDLVDLVASDSRVFVARHPFAMSRQIVSVDLLGENRVENGIAGFTNDPVMAVDATHVYWTAITGLEPSELKRSTHTGMEEEVLATVERTDGLFVAGDKAYFEESDGQTSSFGKLVVTTAGGPLSVLVEQIKLESDILLGNGQHLFFKDEDTLKSCSLTGQDVQPVLATNGGIVAAVADDAALYVAVNAEPLGPAYLIQLAP